MDSSQLESLDLAAPSSSLSRAISASYTCKQLSILNTLNLNFRSVLRIRDVYPGLLTQETRSRKRNKKPQKQEPGFIPDTGVFFFIPNPGCRGQKSTGSRIRNRNTVYNSEDSG
jgi:hypothetical protein